MEAAPDTFFRPPAPEELDAIHALEAAGYPADEAASRERLQYRLTEAPGLFLVAVQADEVIGFVCGTGSSADCLEEESMATHEPEGRLLCIHSVCVAEGKRRGGVATR